MRRFCCALLIMCAACAALAPIGSAATKGNRAAGRAAKLTVAGICNRAYPHQFSRTYNIRFGTKTVYNRDLSRALVCNGGFGAPDNYRVTFGAACDLIFAAYKLRDPTDSHLRDLACAPAEIHDDGWTRGSMGTAKSVVCAYVVSMVAEDFGVFATGVTLDPAVGVGVWQGLTFLGDTVLCIGLGKLTNDARSWGIRLEERHETHVAHDIEVHGKCLQMTKKKVVGIHWSAIDCPSGFRGSKWPSSPAVQGPVDDPGGVPSTTDPDPGNTGGPDAPGPAGGIPDGSVAETAGGVTHTWTDPASAGGTQGPSIQSGQTVGIRCKLQGFRVANGNPWWYRIASGPWSDGYYASADAFYNNGATSGPLQGTPFVDAAVPDCASSTPPSADVPAGSRPETVGGVTHTWTDYTNAGGTQGPSIQTGQTVAVACKVQGFKVADGNTWWYRIASSPWGGSYYASADAFYNNGQTTGSLVGTPFVDPGVPDCFPATPPPPATYAETTGGVTHTWTNPANAGGTQGPSIASNQTVQIACKLQGFRVADGNTWWYRISSSPWNGTYYASADAFYNNGQTSGSLIGTPFVDPAVRDC